MRVDKKGSRQVLYSPVLNLAIDSCNRHRPLSKSVFEAEILLLSLPGCWSS